MSHCGPLTAYFFMSKISLRIWTPLLPLPPARRTWKLSSKSPYCFLLHRKVLNLMPSLPVSPTRAPFMTSKGPLAAGAGPFTARPEEREEAFTLLFQHCPPEEQRPRVARALGLIEKGELNPEGVIVLRGAGGLLGATVGAVVPGGSGL